MREIAVLAQRHVREAWRSPAARRLLLGAFLLLALGLSLRQVRTADAGVALLGAAVVCLLLGGVVAALAGGWLPADRHSGRAVWLATLRPAAWQGRLGAAMGGWGGALLAAILAALFAGALLGIFRPRTQVRSSRPLLLEGAAPGAVLLPPPVALPGGGHAARGAGIEVTLPDDAVGTFEVEFAPCFEGLPHVDRAGVVWEEGRGSPRRGRAETAVHGRLRIELSPGAGVVRLACATPGVFLRVREMRLLGPATSALPALLVCGLLLGLCAASVAPMGVACSRFTSAPTAAALALLLLGFGAAREPLLDLGAALADQGGAAGAAGHVLDAVAWMTPDVPVTRILSDLGAARYPGRDLPDLLSWLLPTLLYTAAGLLLCGLGPPRRARATA